MCTDICNKNIKIKIVLNATVMIGMMYELFCSIALFRVLDSCKSCYKIAELIKVN